MATHRALAAASGASSPRSRATDSGTHATLQVMTSREHASRIAAEYLNSRRKFEHEAEQEGVLNYLGGNDNFIGRIGEFLAMRYLEEFHGLIPSEARRKKDEEKTNESRPAVDLRVGKEWWSVKCVTDESASGKTSPYHVYNHPDKGWIWPPLIIVRLHYIQKGENPFEPWAECLAYPQGLEAATGELGKAEFEASKSLATRQRFNKMGPPVNGLTHYHRFEFV